MLDIDPRSFEGLPQTASVDVVKKFSISVSICMEKGRRISSGLEPLLIVFQTAILEVNLPKEAPCSN